MRTTKFRARKEGLAYNVAGLHWTVAYGEWYGNGVGGGVFWVNNNFDKWNGSPKKIDSILEEFTGYNDINGNEIYEGDEGEITSIHVGVKADGFKGIVKYYEGAFWVDNGSDAHLLWSDSYDFEIKSEIRII